jgi:hypothetical protein
MPSFTLRPNKRTPIKGDHVLLIPITRPPFASGLGFNQPHSGRSDHHMVQIETTIPGSRREVMKYIKTFPFQRRQLLPPPKDDPTGAGGYLLIRGKRSDGQKGAAAKAGQTHGMKKITYRPFSSRLGIDHTVLRSTHFRTLPPLPSEPS